MDMMVRDVAKLFSVSEKTIYRWIATEGLPAFRINKQYRFRQAELAEWATARKINLPQLEQPKPVEQVGPITGLVEAMETGGIFYRVDGEDKTEVLRSIVRMMRLPEAVDTEYLCRILLERETLASTAVGEGIAIPHVRNPVVLQISRPMISLSFLETPVDFGALDGRPVRILFTLISPTIREHLHLLSHLAFALRDQQFRQTILREGSRGEIFGELRRIEQFLSNPMPQKHEVM